MKLINFSQHKVETILLVLSSVFALIIAIPMPLIAQDISVRLSTTYDPNLFDSYSPIEDQVTQAGLDFSKGWDSDQSYLGFSYSGSLSLYENISARNNHVHKMILGLTHHFANEEEDSTATGEESMNEDSAAIDPVLVEAHSDSMDQYLYLTAVSMMQFNKVEYENQNNTFISGNAIFRQPLGILASIRPSYTISYHYYPDLSALTNIQNIFSLQLSTDFLPGNSFALIPALSFKNYPVTQSTNDTAYIIKPGKGKKGGGTTTKVVGYDFNTPSVRQLSYSLRWKYEPSPATRFTTQLTRYNRPSKVARVIPELKQGIEKFMERLLGGFPGQNEIYDDHYSYSGNEIVFQAEQLMPFDAILAASFLYQKKTYTYPAKDLSDTTVVANNREDRRTEFIINFSRSFSLGEEEKLKALFEYHYIKNNTNAPLFDFKKSTYMIGVEFSF